MAGVVPNDEEDVASAGRLVGADELGEVDARNGVGRDRPGGRLSPVAAVDQPRSRVVETVGLGLRQARRGCDGRDLACPVAAVVAHPVDVEVVGGRRGVDLEMDRLATVDADVGGEALDAGIAAAADVPLALGIARLRVLADDRVLDRGVAGGGPCELRTGSERCGQEEPERRQRDGAEGPRHSRQRPARHWQTRLPHLGAPESTFSMLHFHSLRPHSRCETKSPFPLVPLVALPTSGKLTQTPGLT
jgi:hypothetical protein